MFPQKFEITQSYCDFNFVLIILMKAIDKGLESCYKKLDKHLNQFDMNFVFAFSHDVKSRRIVIMFSQL